MWTLACLRGVETVAVGFRFEGRYSGPRDWEGGCESEDMVRERLRMVSQGHVAGIW